MHLITLIMHLTMDRPTYQTIYQASHTAYAAAVHLPARGFLLWGQPFQGTLGWLLAAYNVFACILMGYDKFQAIRGGRRIPENTLFAIALAGGSLGILAGMLIFRHKTRHLSFRLGLPVIVLLQAWLLSRYF